VLAWASGRAAEVQGERVRIAVVPRRPEDWRTVGVTRAARTALRRIEAVYPANATMARKLVPLEPKAPLEALSDVGRRLRVRFIAIVDVPQRDRAAAELIVVGDAERQVTATRQPVRAQAPLHQLPGRLAAKLADALRIRISAEERARVIEPRLSSPEACEAVWRGDATKDLLERQRLYSRAHELEPEAAFIHNRLGTTFARLGHPRSAVAAFNRATQLRPDYAAAYSNCGQVLARQKRWQEAEAVFRKAVALQPKTATSYIGLARLLARQGDTLAAVDQLETAITVDPCHTDALLTLAEFYFEQSELRSARELTRRILDLEPTHVAALNTRGLLSLADREPVLAEASFRTAIKADPEDAMSRANLGLALFAQGRPEEAIAALKKAIARDRSNGKPHFYLGKIYLERKEYQKAIDSFQLAAELSPELAAARVGLRDARIAKMRAQNACCGGGKPRMTSSQAAARTLLLAALLLGPHAARLRRRRRRT
jgi:tetratricopeptide (TPR) repeat protein